MIKRHPRPAALTRSTGYAKRGSCAHGLVWKRNSSTPKILFHARFPEYTERRGSQRRNPRKSAEVCPLKRFGGIYMLFVLDRAGVPSLAKRIYLQ